MSALSARGRIEGRPLKIKTVEELELKIDLYFAWCKENLKPYTMSGLAYALEIDRKTLLSYSYRDEYLLTIKRARDRIQQYVEEKLFDNNVTGVIFNLKNNFGWEDKRSLETADVSKEKYEEWLKNNQKALKDITPDKENSDDSCNIIEHDPVE
jgi:hypothetical protein|tara:strand:+ start:333 stop:794 length:462 start_codon:yes stop_codon:yes gene_type:complete